MLKRVALVCGAGGFIGSHLARDLSSRGWSVRGVDLKRPRWSPPECDDFVVGDLRDPNFVQHVINQPFEVVYQLAADMGGAGYLFTGDNDAEVLHNNALINLNVAEYAYRRGVERLFYASSACVYPKGNQLDPKNIKITEETAYPADPDSEYGWEKLYSERVYQAYSRCRGIDVRIARFHNIYGPEGSYNDGREKAPAAMCRKVAEAPEGGVVDIWGDGRQTRSFCYIDDAIEGVQRLMDTDVDPGPLNIGSDEMVSIDGLVKLVMEVAGKPLQVHHIPGPVGVNARTSDNTRVKGVLGWAPYTPLKVGITKTYNWINRQVNGGSDNG